MDAPRILVVDDERIVAASLRKRLGSLGYDVPALAHSGEEAIELARQLRPDLVLMDIRLEGPMDGVQAATHIRSQLHIPVVYLTAYSNQEILDRAKITEPFGYILKPYEERELRIVVEMALSRDRLERKYDQERRWSGAILASSADAIIGLTAEGLITSWNPAAERLYGYSAGEVLGRPILTVVPAERTGDLHGVLDWLRQGEVIPAFETEQRRKDGGRVSVLLSVSPIKDGTGRILGFSTIAHDMTERKRLEEQSRRAQEMEAARRAAEEYAEVIQEQREHLRVTLQSIGDAVIATDAQGRVTLLNPVAEALTGWTTAAALGRPLQAIFRIIHEKTRQPLADPAARALTSGQIVDLPGHTLLIARDGTERPIDDSAAPIRDEKGNTAGAVLVFRDITARKRAADALRESEERFRNMADNAPVMIWVTDTLGRLTYLNTQWYHFTGTAPDQGLGPGWLERVHPDDRDQAEAVFRAAHGRREAFRREYRLRRHDGEYRWAIDTAVPRFGMGGEFLGCIGSVIDVADLKRAEQTTRFLADASAALAELTDYESTLQRIASLAVPRFADWCTVDMLQAEGPPRRLAVRHTDPAKMQLAEEVYRKYPPRPDDPRSVALVLRTGETDWAPEIPDWVLETACHDAEHLRIMRELGLKSYICVPLRSRTGLLGAITFVTAESGRVYDAADVRLGEDLARRAEIAIENVTLLEALQQADRRKDEFLATLAHELRNPLAPIRNSLQILKMPRVDAAMAERTREMMERQVQHLVRLVDDLLDVSRVMRGKIVLRKERIELASVVARAVETTQPLIAAQDHELKVLLPRESLPVEADPVRLVQVVGNLLTNAAKYTERGGEIQLTVQRERGQVLLRVRDSGIGIALELLPRVFDLFVQGDHTANRAQGGLGIGLTLVKNLVEMHHGTVEAHSAGLGHGSEFVVRLPLWQGEQERGQEDTDRDQAGMDPKRASGRLYPCRRVLVVDDNVDAAESLAVLLRLGGHEVRVAHDGPGGLRLAQSDRPEVVFLDIGMPGMDGYEVARRLRQQAGRERMLVVALTGWGAQEDRRLSAEAGFDRHLVKPVEPHTLEEMLRKEIL